MGASTNPIINGDCHLNVADSLLATDFGGYWDGTNDDSAAIQAAVDAAAALSPRKNVMLPKSVCIKSSIFVPSRVHIIGYNYSTGRINTSIYPHASMSLSTGFMFNMNTTDGTTATTTPALGQWWECGIFGVWLSNAGPNKAGARLALYCGTFIAHDIRAYNHTQIFKKLSGLYIDNTEIKRVMVGDTYDNSEYSIELGTGGQDCMILEEMNFPTSTASGTPEKAIYIWSGNQGRISNIINGTIKLKYVNNFEISKYHSEFGQILLEDSNCRVSDSSFQVHTADTYYPIDASTINTPGNTYEVTLENVQFIQGQQNYDAVITAEIKTTYQVKINFINCARSLRLANNQASSGVRVADASDALLAQWAVSSYYLSSNGVLSGYRPSGSYSAVVVNDFTGVSGTITKVTGWGSSTFTNSQTYYYKAQLLIGDPASLVGVTQTGAEISVTMSATVANTQRNYIPLGWGTNSTSAFIRLYRGTSAGSYDKVANIPYIMGRSIVDIGDYVGGIAWSSRGAAAVDTLTSGVGTFLVSPYGKVAVA